MLQMPKHLYLTLKSWEMIINIKCEFDQYKTDPHEAVIWNNSDIKIAGQLIFCKSWHKVGIK